MQKGIWCSVFGELVPKRIAMKNHEKLANYTIGIVRFISIVTAPFVKLLTLSTNIVSKIFGVTETDEEVVTEEEIRIMVDVGEEKGSIEEEEKELAKTVRKKLRQVDHRYQCVITTEKSYIAQGEEE